MDVTEHYLIVSAFSSNANVLPVYTVHALASCTYCHPIGCFVYQKYFHNKTDNLTKCMPMKFFLC